MNKLRQKLVILGIIFLGILIRPSYIHAQYAPGIIDTGTVVYDMTFTDINGVETNLYDYLDQGYMVVVELSLTTCAICWKFHNEGVFENVYKKYGPAGSVLPKKIMPIFIECNPNTTSDDLHGRGSNTMGDWVKGVSYPIVDLTHENINSILGNLFKSNNQGFPTPTFLIICPDGKLVFSDEGIGRMDATMLLETMEGRCGIDGSSTGIDQVIPSTSVHVYPNPTQSTLHINLEALSNIHVKFTISNVLGQTFVSESASLEQGIQTKSLNVDHLASGMYILSIITDQGMIQEKFVIRK
jgi:hypothetical protein